MSIQFPGRVRREESKFKIILGNLARLSQNEKRKKTVGAAAWH